MSTIQCVCGTRFRVEQMVDGGSVYCPNCGQALVPQGVAPEVYYKGATPPQVGAPAGGGQYVAGAGSMAMPAPPPQQSNSAAVAGFILALLSFFMCLLLAPIAVIVSLQGLKHEDNKGFAVAGLVIGSIQSVGLLIVIGYFVVMFLVIGGLAVGTAATVADATVDGFETLADQVETQISIEEASAEIHRHHAEHGEWPDSKNATSIVSEYTDAWGQPLEYDDGIGGTWVIVSAGPDGRRGSSDDIKASWSNNSSEVGEFLDHSFTGEIPLDTGDIPLDEGPPSGVIEDVPEAIEKLKSSDNSDTRQALLWLAEADVDDEYRTAVVEAAVDLFDERRFKDEAVRLTAVWFSGEQAQLLGDYLNGLADHEADRSATVLVALLNDPDAEAQLLLLMNHPADRIRNEVRATLRLRPQLATATIEQSIEDLADEDRAEHAVEYLHRTEVIDELKAEVATALDPLITDSYSNTRRLAIEALGRWGPTTANIDSLARAGQLDLLVQIQDPKVLDHLGDMLERWPVDFRKAADKMRDIGTPAESAVWPILEQRNHVIVNDALRLLGEIGSERSIPRIEPLLEERLMASAAKQALSQIQAAKREPQDWPPANQ